MLFKGKRLIGFRILKENNLLISFTLKIDKKRLNFTINRKADSEYDGKFFAKEDFSLKSLNDLQIWNPYKNFLESEEFEAEITKTVPNWKALEFFESYNNIKARDVNLIKVKDNTDIVEALFQIDKTYKEYSHRIKDKKTYSIVVFNRSKFKESPLRLKVWEFIKSISLFMIKNGIHLVIWSYKDYVFNGMSLKTSFQKCMVDKMQSLELILKSLVEERKEKSSNSTNANKGHASNFNQLKPSLEEKSSSRNSESSSNEKEKLIENLQLEINSKFKMNLTKEAVPDMLKNLCDFVKGLDSNSLTLVLEETK